MKINCAKTLGRQLRQLLVEKGTALADDLAGKSVIRQGEAMTVESVKMADRKITTVDMMGKRETQSFDRFFREPVAIIQPDLLLQDITGDDVDVSRVGRYLFRGGQRWQVNKITKNEAGTLLTLESDGQFTIKSRDELIRERWQIRKRAKPTVSQRLAGIYSKLGEQLDTGKTWAAPVPPSLESKRAAKLSLALKIYRRERTKVTL